jgi:hypothetical protein
LEALQHFKAVESGQHQIQHHEIGTALGHTGQCVEPIGRDARGIAGALEVPRHHLCDRRFVVDDED